jgi:predicted metal-dependent peptidase
MMATKLEKAKAQLVLDHPFFASILLRKELRMSKAIPTLGIDAQGNIYVNPDFIETLDVPQIVWGFCHEIGHWIGQHFPRRKHRDHKRWNYAGDAWINDWLKDCNVGTPIPNTVNMPGSYAKTVDEIYDNLPEQDGKGKGPGNGPGYDNGLGDEFVGEDELTDAEINAIEAEVKVTIAQAAQAAKMQGKLSAAIARVVDEIINVKTPWYEILERFMIGFTKNEQSWKRPNRRFLPLDIYLPSIQSTPSMGEVVVEIDTSGSIGQRELNEFSAQLNRLVDLCRPEKVHVVYCDSEINHVDEYTMDDLPIKMEPHGGGGTDMTQVFKWIENEGIDPDCVVVLTDGYTPYPEEEKYPTVWAMTTDQVAPASAGTTIKLECEEETTA